MIKKLLKLVPGYTPTVAGALDAFNKTLADLENVSRHHSRAAHYHSIDAAKSITLQHISAREATTAHEVRTKLAAIISPTK